MMRALAMIEPLLAFGIVAAVIVILWFVHR